MRHPGLVTKGHFNAVISMCERAIVSDIVCPFCGIKLTIHTLQKHLGLHLQEVALFVLPHPDEDRNKINPDNNLSKKSSFEFNSDSKQPVGNLPEILPIASEDREESKCNLDVSYYEDRTIQNTYQGLMTLSSGGLEDTIWKEVVGNPFAGHSGPLTGLAGDPIRNNLAFGEYLSPISLSGSTHHSPAPPPLIQQISGQELVLNSPFLSAQNVEFGFSSPQHNMAMQPPRTPLLQGTQGPNIYVDFAPPQRYLGRHGPGLDRAALSPPPECKLLALLVYDICKSD